MRGLLRRGITRIGYELGNGRALANARGDADARTRSMAAVDALAARVTACASTPRRAA